MAVASTKVISTGTNVDTGFQILQGLQLDVSAAATVTVRVGASNGVIVAQQVFAAAGNVNLNFGAEGIRCPVSGTGTFFVVTTAGTVTGGAYGQIAP